MMNPEIEKGKEGGQMNEQILKILSIPKVQEEIKKAMLSWERFDIGYFNEEGKIASFSGYFSENGYEFVCGDEMFCGDPIRIPSFCDFGEDGQPTGRCLWGMVDWERFTGEPNEDGSMDIHERYEGDYKPRYWRCWNESPYLAFLKTLCKQWGIEV